MPHITVPHVLVLAHRLNLSAASFPLNQPSSHRILIIFIKIAFGDVDKREDRLAYLKSH